MSESEHSFILVSSNNNAVSVHSMDAWSEISFPSDRSAPKNIAPATTFSVFTGTYLHNVTTLLPGFAGNNTTTQVTEADKGYYLVNPPIHFSSNSLSNLSANDIDEKVAGESENVNNVNIASIGSVGSRVPFSWAEITKIQPQFHNQINKSKVFIQTTKIRTRYRSDNSKSKNTSPKIGIKSIMDNQSDDDIMPAIPELPESSPYATKKDLGRRIRKGSKRGSRLKYPAKKRYKRNWRKKNQNK